MKSAWLISIALFAAAPEATSGDPPSPKVSPQQAQAEETEQTLTPDELRQAYRTVLRRSAKRADPDPAEVIPQLVAVYVALGDAEGFAHRQLSRMRGVVKARLEQFRDRLLRDQWREKQTRASRRRAPRDSTTAEQTTEPAGGAVNTKTGALIALIQTVIEPDHWNVNGGPGSITYYPPGHALVIRARADVHEQIGTTLHQLRRLGP